MKKILDRIIFILLSFVLVTSHASALTCTTLTKSLSKGSENNEVLALQNFLAESGHLTVKPNGYFGENTRKALVAFQKKHSISGTGTAGPLTSTKIKAISCASTSQSPEKKIIETVTQKQPEQVVVKETPQVPQAHIPTIYVKTLFPSDVTSSEAILKGSGGIDGEKHWFEWGLAMGTTTQTPQVAASTTFSHKITGLSPGTGYYFRALTSVATSTERKGEVAYGEMRYFTTPGAAVTAPPKPTVTISSTGAAVNTSGSAKITWTSTNASICSFTEGESGGDWTRQTAVSGEYITRPMTTSATFGINCKNNAGYTVTASVAVSKIVN